MKKNEFILIIIGTVILVLGMISIIVVPILNKHICDNTTNIQWYINNCFEGDDKNE